MEEPGLSRSCTCARKKVSGRPAWSPWISHGLCSAAHNADRLLKCASTHYHRFVLFSESCVGMTSRWTLFLWLRFWSADVVASLSCGCVILHQQHMSHCLKGWQAGPRPSTEHGSIPMAHLWTDVTLSSIRLFFTPNKSSVRQSHHVSLSVVYLMLLGKWPKSFRWQVMLSVC